MSKWAHASLRAYACACVRACVRACVPACVRACVRGARTHASSLRCGCAIRRVPERGRARTTRERRRARRGASRLLPHQRRRPEREGRARARAVRPSGRR
eukprot:5714496-Pleurochrysis_carterae.AAC.1